MYDSSFFYENLKVPTVAMGERLCLGVTAGAEGRPGGSQGMGLKGEPREHSSTALCLASHRFPKASLEN